MGNIFKTQITFNCEAIVIRCVECIGKGWVYVHELKENLTSLETSVGQLRGIKNDMMRRISNAERKGKKCSDEVQFWFSRVDNKIDESNMLLKNRQHQIAKLCIGGCCSTNCYSSYKFAKKVDKRLKEVKDLVKQQKEFKEIAIVALPEPKVAVPVGTTVGLKSKLDSINSYLLDKDVGIVGIFGEGKVGKTTLLMEANNNICDETNSFELVILVNVSRQSMHESIQNHIGQKIGYSGEEWTSKSLYDKAVDILNVLKKKKFVLLLDNIFEAIDLTELGIPQKRLNMDYKVVFTTNSKRICSQMGAQKIVEVEPLGFEDSWGLFLNRIGEDILNANPEIHDLAKKLVRECCGIPIILIKWAKEMASKSTTQDWIDALKSSKTPLIDLEGIIDSKIAIEKDDDKWTTTLGGKVAATNVFGSPITDKTVRELPQYAGRRRITSKDRAVVAFAREAEDGKDVKAREYVNWLKMKYKDEHSTIGLFYNATGCTLNFSVYKDWHGYFNEGLYPKSVENGQWGVFVHMHEDSIVDRGGSSGAIVYSGENAFGDECDWMLAWDNPSVVNQAHTKVFTEAREKNHFHNCWLIIYDLLSKSGRQRRDTWGGCLSDISVEDTNGPFLTATLSLSLESAN
ncbi:hypothetical protein KSS87_001765 [Heliosperma pusillum]|nr:hypothetical protein KSS87_001765 [Heliosperma pusillum]